MKWNDITYYRRMELALWAELDKAGVILEPGSDRLPAWKQDAFVRAVLAWREKYTWASDVLVADITGLKTRSVTALISRKINIR